MVTLYDIVHKEQYRTMISIKSLGPKCLNTDPSLWKLIIDNFYVFGLFEKQYPQSVIDMMRVVGLDHIINCKNENVLKYVRYHDVKECHLIAAIMKSEKALSFVHKYYKNKLSEFHMTIAIRNGNLNVVKYMHKQGLSIFLDIDSMLREDFYNGTIIEYVLYASKSINQEEFTKIQKNMKLHGKYTEIVRLINTYIEHTGYVPIVKL